MVFTYFHIFHSISSICFININLKCHWLCLQFKFLLILILMGLNICQGSVPNTKGPEIFKRVCFLIWLPHHGVSQAEKNFCILHELGNRMQRVVLGGLIANPPKPPSHSLWHNKYFEYSTKVRVAVSVG